MTLQPLARYDLDAAILFSDILTVPDAMGLGLYFAEGEGPRFERPLRDAEVAAPRHETLRERVRFVERGTKRLALAWAPLTKR